MSELEDYDEEIFAVEERIGRLAIACRIDLTDSAQLAAVRNGNHNGSDQDEHGVHLLRHLLVLKDYITLHCVQDRGAEECRHIMEEIDNRLRQHGFRK